MSGTVGVERIFPIESPAIDSITVNKVGKVRRAKLYYLRALTGKKARIQEKELISKIYHSYIKRSILFQRILLFNLHPFYSRFLYNHEQTDLK